MGVCVLWVVGRGSSWVVGLYPGHVDIKQYSNYKLFSTDFSDTREGRGSIPTTCQRRKYRNLPDEDFISTYGDSSLDSSLNESLSNSDKEAKSLFNDQAKKGGRKFFTLIKTVHETLTVKTISINSDVTIGISIVCSDSELPLEDCR
ncbi:UNVERIFIED_CONTAM: hypothetical protein RMT77_013091 [Armadillidium vulgare]